MKDTEIVEVLEQIQATLSSILDVLSGPNPGDVQSPDQVGINAAIIAAASARGRLDQNGMPIEIDIEAVPQNWKRLVEKTKGTVWQFPGGRRALALVDGVEFLIDLNNGSRIDL